MAFDRQTILAVWNKARAVDNYDSSTWRQDKCGAWMKFQFYGNRQSSLGWEIDHIIPKDRGGSDNLTNLRPLQWENNAAKSDGQLRCAVTSEGNRNVRARAGMM